MDPVTPITIIYRVSTMPTQRCTWKFNRRTAELLRPVEIALEEAQIVPLRSRLS